MPDVIAYSPNPPKKQRTIPTTFHFSIPYIPIHPRHPFKAKSTVVPSLLLRAPRWPPPLDPLVNCQHPGQSPNNRTFRAVAQDLVNKNKLSTRPTSSTLLSSRQHYLFRTYLSAPLSAHRGTPIYISQLAAAVGGCPVADEDTITFNTKDIGRLFSTSVPN